MITKTKNAVEDLEDKVKLIPQNLEQKNKGVEILSKE